MTTIGLENVAKLMAERGRRDAERMSPGVTSLAINDEVEGLGVVAARDDNGVTMVDDDGRHRNYSWRALAQARQRFLLRGVVVWVRTESRVYHMRHDCPALVSAYGGSRPAKFDAGGKLRYADDYGRRRDGTHWHVPTEGARQRRPCARCSS